MYRKKVKDLMIPVKEYPAVDDDATMLDAVKALHDAQEKSVDGVPAFRAVLILNKKKKVIGKIGHIGFLKALEPKYQQVFDMEKLTRASLSSNFLDSLMEQMNLWGKDMLDICSVAKKTKVIDIMQPIEENIDENESIGNAIHKIIMWQTLSILVSRGKEIVGILRLSDIYSGVESYIINECKKNN